MFLLLSFFSFTVIEIVLQTKLETKVILISSLGTIFIISMVIMTYCFCKLFVARRCIKRKHRYKAFYDVKKESVIIGSDFFSQYDVDDVDSSGDVTAQMFADKKIRSVENEYHWGGLKKSPLLYKDVDDIFRAANDEDLGFEINRDLLEITGVLGEGAFGIVKKAKVLAASSTTTTGGTNIFQRSASNDYITVAVKMIKGNV